MKSGFSLLILVPCFSFSQGALTSKMNIPEYKSNNPFRTNVFVENSGQFNGWAGINHEEILFAVNNGNKVFFTNGSLIFRTDKLEKKEDAEENYMRENDKDMNEEAKEEIQRKKYKMKNYYVNMKWAGSNKDAVAEGKDKVNGYYTYGEKGYEKIRANGYGQLICRNLYQGVDVEYKVPSSDSNGIKYKIIIHPGGDYKSVKMQYSGDIKDIRLDHSGNIVIESMGGRMIDHSPSAFYAETGKPVEVKFAKDKNDCLYFDFPGGLESDQTIIIDPWIVIPNTLTNNNRAYDVDFDDYGNVYIFGGSYPYKLSKYDGSGILLWTYTIPLNFSGYGWNLYSEFALIRKSGSVFIGEGVGVPSVVKINSSGGQVFLATIYSSNNEIWEMFYNPCNGKMFGFGGGNTGMPENLYLFNDTNVNDTNLAPVTMINFNNGAGGLNDVADAIIDVNGDFYGLIASNNSANLSNYLHKSLQSNGYYPPTGFSVSSGYNFKEICANGIFAGGSCVNGGNTSNRANALSLNVNYLFGYDGKTVKAWDKTNGNLLGSIVVNAGYTDGKDRTHEGIAADDCNNIVVGGYQAIHAYSFNGATFTSLGNITTNVPNEVYDLMLDEGRGMLYASGNGFLSAISVPLCNSFSVTPAVNSACSGIGSATVTPAGGIPPYTYQWSNGATTSAVSNLSPGTYTVIIWDGSCIKKTAIGTVVITGGGLSLTPAVVSAACYGNNNGTATITASTGTAPYTYFWNTSPPQTTQTATGLSAGTYSVVVTDANGCTAAQTVSVTNQPQVAAVISSDPGSTVCVGQNVFISASGGITYSWNTGATTAYIVATPSVTTTYSVTVTDASGCTGTGTLTVPVNPGCTATGISQTNTDAFQVEIWPSLSNGIFNVQWLWASTPSGMANGNTSTMEVYNVMGEKIYTSVDFQINRSSPQGVLGTSFQIDLSEQPGGVYFLKLKTGDAIINKKIIIQK
ncbi:MAG: T9SS type A sorting domain-containing protein [Bacteroidetes bacterium]|nr:MAG: T9SS type A sorting domain-containing protein [Bacteroidota bacterium]